MTTLSFAILGPLVVSRQGEPCRVGRPKARQLLATLLLHPNSFVATELIADVLWQEAPPRSAAANIRTYVRELRELCDTEDPTCIETHGGGYSVVVPEDALDATRFRALVAEVERRSDAGDQAGALRLAEQAYGLWRSHPLDDLPIAAVWQVPLDRLERERVQLQDALVGLWMRSGEHRKASGVLRERIADEPYAEPLWCRYVTCLAADSRVDEARQAAAEIRRLLAEDLGVAPSEPLAVLERQVAGSEVVSLMRQRSVHRDGELERLGQEWPAPPCQLPHDVPDFTGRAAELDRLRMLLTDQGGHRPQVAVLSGAPGVGKTTCAVHLGHALRDSFPDGQLFLDMRGVSSPREPADAAADLLGSLGIQDAAIPAEPDRRAAALRSELAGRRVLVVLDDVGSAQQAATLLPGTGSSAMLITSRRRLTDLTGGARHTLGELDGEESAALLAGVVGEQRPPLRPAETQAILGACGRLPLAIRVAGSRLAQRRDLSAATLAERLLDERRRLDELRVGDLTVRASADLSYETLDRDEARLYHLLGLLGTTEIPAWLLNESGIGPDPERCVDALIEANLVQVVGTDTAGFFRYRIHDLLRCHALDLAMERDPQQAYGDLADVLSLLLARSVWMADRLPSRFFGVTVELAPKTASAQVGGAPVEWFDAHRDVLTSVVRAAADRGADSLAWQLAASWAPYLDLRAHYQEWQRSHSAALESARRSGSRIGEAVLLRNLGQLALYRDEYRSAEGWLRRAHRLFVDLAHHQGAGVAAVGLGTYYRIHDDDAAAMRWYLSALEDFLAAEDRGGEAVARNAVGGVWLRMRRPVAAAPWLREAFDLAMRTGDRHREAQVRRRIAKLREQEGDSEAAVQELRSALDLLVELGDEHCAAYVRRSLGAWLTGRGDFGTARRMLVLALNAGHRMADRRAEALAAWQLGDLAKAMDEAERARWYFRRAERTWRHVAGTEGTAGRSPPPADRLAVSADAE